MVRNLQIRIIKFLVLIPLYYIVGDKSIYLYVLSLALYKIFSCCFFNVSIKETLKKYQDNYVKYKIFKLTSLIICVVSLVFLLLGIAISDVVGNILNINNSFLPFLLMGISIVADPLVKNFLEYIESYNYKKFVRVMANIYDYLDVLLLIVVSLIGYRWLELSDDVRNALLYLPKIISAVIINIILYLVVIRKKRLGLVKNKVGENVNYKEEIKIIINENNLGRFVLVSKEIFYYTSIIILYLMLTKRYSYLLEDTTRIITFVYFYGLNFINLLIMVIIRRNNDGVSIFRRIYYVFDKLLSISIILGVISPLVCMVIFNNRDWAIYLMMIGFMVIFTSLYEMTFKEINNYKLGYLSLGVGILVKFILVIPLIDSFYRMGYNLVYGDIISTIVGMFISVIINYIYLKRKDREEKCFEKILKSLYENIFLCIILVIVQFIIPVMTDNYFIALIKIFGYVFISLMFLRFKEKRGM